MLKFGLNKQLLAVFSINTVRALNSSVVWELTTEGEDYSYME